jgi:DnaJ-class molecular chaperone
MFTKRRDDKMAKNPFEIVHGDRGKPEAANICPRCSGTGTIRGSTCTRCNGTGKR